VLHRTAVLYSTVVLSSRKEKKKHRFALREYSGQAPVLDFAQDDTKERAERNLEFGPSPDASKGMRRPLPDRKVPLARL
jgi:hypothetical protein